MSSSRKVAKVAIRGLTALFILLSVQGEAAIQFLVPDADTSLLQVATNNNIGAAEWILSGTTQNNPNTRGLLRFDFSGLPSSSIVRSAQVVVTVTRQPADGQENAAFGLHRMFKGWTEGRGFSPAAPGQGSPAEPGETTWSYQYYPTVPWAAPGGAVGVDYSSIQSSFQFIYGANSAYTFETTPEMVEDVQSWVSFPNSNFGWMLKCADEGVIFTGRRFGSREDPMSPPVLEVDYLVAPVFDNIQRSGTNVQLWFTQWPDQIYELQVRSLTETGWQFAANFPASPVKVSVSWSEPATNSFRLYRLLTH